MTSFIHGNYDWLYRFRRWRSEWESPRMRLLFSLLPLFTSASVLDVGCHAGRLSVRIADELRTRHLLGLDIDSRLIAAAATNLIEWRKWRRAVYPQGTGEATVEWRTGDVLTCALPAVYDVVVCCHVTKWVHVNGGDAAIHRLFAVLVGALRAGGVLILQAQEWGSYEGGKLTAEQRRRVKEMVLRPEGFVEMLTGMGMELIHTLVEGDNAASPEGRAQVGGGGEATAGKPVDSEGKGKERRKKRKKGRGDEQRPMFVLRKRG